MKGIGVLVIAICICGAVTQNEMQGTRLRVIIGGSGGKECNSYDPSYEPCEAVIKRELSYNCDRHLLRLTDSMFNQNGYGAQQAYFEVTYRGHVKLFRIQSLCQIYNWCNRCGNNGKCELKDRKTVCKCNSGFRGKFCNGSVDSTKNIVVAAVVVCGLFALLVVAAAISHACWTKRGKYMTKGSQIHIIQADPCKQPLPSFHGYANFGQRKWSQRGDPTLTCPVHSCPRHSHQAPKRSTLTITELADDGTPISVPAEPLRPMVYTTIPVHRP